MREFQIFSDSSCDLPEVLVAKKDIRIIPFYVSFDQDIYYKENVDITNREFFERLEKEKGAITTSLPTVQEYISEFKGAIRKGLDVLCICLSQKFSGSYQSAVNAKTILEEQYPEAQIEIIDSIQATAGQGLFLLQAAALKEHDKSLEETVAQLERLKSTARIMFTVDTLEYLAKGRRIGKAISLASDILDLKPLIQLKDGELIPYSKVRGRKASLNRLIAMTEEYFTQTGESPEDYDFCIANATTLTDAEYLVQQLEQVVGRKLSYPVFQIGVTIGTYTGPGGIGICFIKKYNNRKEEG
jgi:DegV family protein with EDD domain